MRFVGRAAEEPFALVRKQRTCATASLPSAHAHNELWEARQAQVFVSSYACAVSPKPLSDASLEGSAGNPSTHSLCFPIDCEAEGARRWSLESGSTERARQEGARLAHAHSETPPSTRDSLCSNRIDSFSSARASGIRTSLPPHPNLTSKCAPDTKQKTAAGGVGFETARVGALNANITTSPSPASSSSLSLCARSLFFQAPSFPPSPALPPPPRLGDSPRGLYAPKRCLLIGSSARDF
ncbi:Hypothetical predicted protein [Podarcis lilfordi]|uniref:Uncharacterized protein n=1 Tax=Podarcis lilfordi TaxID=74358 RepID=A0AA35L7H2_9SAUR|nr:Hypothetical predicted protein [Podarcis lilfordi]